MGLLDGLMSQLGQQSGDQAGQGGLAGIAESLLGGANQEGGVGALLPSVLGWVQSQGGVGNVVSTLESSGLGAQAQSWVSNGANQALDPEHINQLLGSDQVTALAAKAGLSPEQVQSGVAALLPHIINHLTPNGETPSADESNSAINGVLGKLGGLFS